MQNSLIAQDLALSPCEKTFIALVGLLQKSRASESTYNALEEGLLHFPKSTQLLVLRGENYLRRGLLEEAETAFLKILETKTVAEALQGLARISQRQRNWKKALDRWSLCLQQFPNHPLTSRWLASKANALLELTRYNEAETILVFLTTHHARRPDGYVGMARSAQRRGDWTSALARWRECVDRFPNHTQVYIWKQEEARTLTKLGRYTDAESIYRSLLYMNPKLAGAYEGLGRIAEYQGQLYVAADQYRDCLCEFPEHPLTLYWHVRLAGILLRLGDLDGAEAEFQVLTYQFPTSPTGYNGLYRVKQRRKQP